TEQADQQLRRQRLRKSPAHGLSITPSVSPSRRTAAAAAAQPRSPAVRPTPLVCKLPAPIAASAAALAAIAKVGRVIRAALTLDELLGAGDHLGVGPQLGVVVEQLLWAVQVPPGSMQVCVMRRGWCGIKRSAAIAGVRRMS